jgi:hypothetical protein
VRLAKKGAIAMNWNLLKRWDFWFGVVGVVGVVFAIYEHFHTQKTGLISYSIFTQKIFDPNNLRGFKLLSPGGSTVEQSVFASELVLWNSGDLSVSAGSDRIREPIKLELLDGTINYFNVGPVNLVKLDNYNITILDDQKSAVISWKFFDPGQGIRITFVHSGGDGTAPVVTGKFFETALASKNIKDVDGNKQTLFLRIFSVLALVVAIVSFVLAYNMLFRFPPRTYNIADLAGSIFSGIVFLLFFILNLYQIYQSNSSIPPV